MTVEIRRASHTFVERVPGRLSRHGFSFGEAYDPDQLRFGPMVCHDEHLLGRGHGFDAHTHRDVVVVSWVVSGALEHDGPGGSAVVEPGSVAVLTTGDGVEHAEHAALPQTRFVQVWLADERPVEPSYVVTPVDVGGADGADGAALTPVAEPLPGSRFLVARPAAGGTVTLPAAPLVHVFVARGALLRSSLAEPLAEGDAFRFTDEPEHRVTAAVDSELLVWAFDG